MERLFPNLAEGLVGEGTFVRAHARRDVALARDTDVGYLLIAADLASGNHKPLFTDETLEPGMNKFDLHDRPTLPVVQRDDPTRIVGMLDRRQILNLYERVSLLGGAEKTDSSQDMRQIGG